MQGLKFLIVLPYEDKPDLVKNALNSIKKAHSYYQNWVLSFIDSSKTPGKKILYDIIDVKKIIYSYVNEQNLGHYINLSLIQTDADICIILPETNEIIADYLYNLNLFFNSNPRIKSCWSKLHAYYPDFEKSSEVNNLISSSKSSVPHNQIDISQLAWRTTCFKDDKIMFDNTNNCFESFLIKMNKLGNCMESGTIAQYQGRTKDKYSLNCIENAYESYLSGNLTDTIKILKKGLKNQETDELRSSLGVILSIVDPKEGIAEINKTKYKEEIGKIRKNFKIELNENRLRIVNG